MYYLFRYTLITSLAALVVGCSGKSRSSDTTPIADAGEDKTYVLFSNDYKDFRTQESELYINKKESDNTYIYLLDGDNHRIPLANECNITDNKRINIALSAENSIEGDSSLSYSWEITAKPKNSMATLLKSNDAHAVLQIDKFGDYQIKLVTSDGISSSKADFVTVSLKNKLRKSALYYYEDQTSQQYYNYTFNDKDQITGMEIKSIRDDMVYTMNHVITYDDQGRMVLEETNSTVGYWEIYRYDYDTAGNMIRSYEKDSTGWFEDINTTYDVNGRIIFKSLTNDNFPNSVWKEYYTYDENNHLIRIARDIGDGSSWTSRFEYNELGELIKGYSVDGSLESEVYYSYDDEGRLVNKYTVYVNSDEWYEISYEYEDNRITRYTNSNTGWWGSIIYTYDEDGTLIRDEEEYFDSRENESLEYQYELYPQ